MGMATRFKRFLIGIDSRDARTIAALRAEVRSLQIQLASRELDLTACFTGHGQTCSWPAGKLRQRLAEIDLLAQSVIDGTPDDRTLGDYDSGQLDANDPAFCS